MTDETPLIADGGVLVGGGRIKEVGRFQDLRKERACVKEVEGVITPALINAHAHLELSHLGEVLSESLSGDGPRGIVDWIRLLIAARDKAGDGSAVRAAARAVLERLAAEGCAVVADIGNNPDSRLPAADSSVQVYFFLEYIGLSQAAQEKLLAGLNRLPSDCLCTGHSPYSTGPALLVELKRRARISGTIFPLHVAESAEEIDFLRTGRGPFRDFLLERQAWDGTFLPPGVGSVSYLARLGLLDRQTLCVHCVHIDEDEITLLAASRATVCLCPGSNRTLGVGKPPVSALVEHGIPLALGTDSLASNPELSLWREMRLLKEDHPDLLPEAIFAMACRGGATGLGLEAEFGKLAEGMSSRMLGVTAPRLKQTEVFEFLVNQGGQTPIMWLA